MGNSARRSRKCSLKIVVDKVASGPVQRIHTDMVRPMERISLGKISQFVAAVDEHSGFFSIGIINRNRETAISVIEMIHEIEILFNLKLETKTSWTRISLSGCSLTVGVNTWDISFKTS